MRLRSELRTRLGSILALALIVGVVGGVVIAAAAGARRTASAYPRFLQEEREMDVVIGASVKHGDVAQAQRYLAQAEHLPQVAAAADVSSVAAHLEISGRPAPGNTFPILSPDNRFGTVVNGVKILEGRMYTAGATDEIVPSFWVAKQFGLRVGQTVRLGYGGFYADSPPKGFTPPSRTVAVHVVGIGAIPNAFQGLGGSAIPLILVSPGFATAHPQFMIPPDISAAIHLRHGASDVSAYVRGVLELKATLPPHNGLGVVFNGSQQTVGVQQATRIQATALWVLAALVAVAGLAIIGQALARQTFIESIEYPTLTSLGMSPSQLFSIGMLRAAVTGIAAAGVGAAIGFLLSPLTPTGIARIAEPHPGFAFDATAVGAGAAAIALLVLMVSAIPAWRSSRASRTAFGAAEVRASRHPSVVAGFLARAAFPPSAPAGVRMAFEPGRGRTAVPVRTTILGATIGLLAVCAALGFGSSLNRLLDTPALSGWNWDAIMFGESDNPAAVNPVLERAVDQSRDVVAYSVGTVVNVRFGEGLNLLAIAMDSRRGSVTPSLIEGRLPRGPDEAALGTETLRDLHASIGDIVPVHAAAGDFRMRVVGRIAMATFPFSFTRAGQGGAFSLAGANRVAGDRGSGLGVFVRFAPGAHPTAFIDRVKEDLHGHLFTLRGQDSQEVKNLDQIGTVPVILAGIIALMAAATLAHTLVTSIRRRRTDLAILKTLGFVRRQVSVTIAWQATAIAAVALVIGVPLGVVAGRWGWNVFADHMGVVPDAAVPVLAVLLIAPATLLVANAIALVPGRLASRLHPATALRTE
jgi:ABC-type lipoprotein release transport system permease subunit